MLRFTDFIADFTACRQRAVDALRIRTLSRQLHSVLAVVVITAFLAMAVACGTNASGSAAVTVASAKPALTVVVVTPTPELLPVTISANGNIMAWQEASIGTEASGLRLTNVYVNVGDTVRRGQVLAAFASDTMAAELAQSGAAVAEAEAVLAEASGNAERARKLKTTGAMSAQQINLYITAERTAQARLAATRAADRTQQLRLAQTRVLASDDGVISARSATVGSVPPAGEELFRLIRRGRLEWRAEVAASEVAKLKPGQVAHLTPVGGGTIEGRVRVLAPTIDMQTRNGLVYVDLPTGLPLRAGMFARGEFDAGAVRTITLPQSAVTARDGFNYVMRVGPDSTIAQTKVTVGRRVGDRVAITGGIEASTRVIASGGSFLGDGDVVRVLDDVSIADTGQRASDPAADAANQVGTR